MTRFVECNNQELKQQIGRMNLLAVSGGRVHHRRTGITLPCGYGYRVTVDLAAGDTYTVRRLFVRGATSIVKGERTGVYAEQVGEVVYRVGMFRDKWE